MKVITLDKNGKEIDLSKVELPKELQIQVIKVMKGSERDGARIRQKGLRHHEANVGSN